MRIDPGRIGATLLLCATSVAQTPVWFRRTEWPWPAATNMSVAVDADRGVTVLVGLVSTYAFTAEWDGTRWVDRMPNPQPAAPTIVYDSLRKVIVGSTGGET